MKLLLVDDDSDQLELRSLTLQNAGYETCVAGNAPAALRVAAKENPQVAVVDLNLPTEEAGLRLIGALKALDERMRVIVLTGSDVKRLDRTPERASVEAVFTKGSGARQLVAHLRASGGMLLRSRLAAEGELMLDVKVIPRSSRSEIAEVFGDGSLKVKLAAIPEKGKANDELVSLMAEYFDVRKDAVELISGETSTRKRLKIRGPKTI